MDQGNDSALGAIADLTEAERLDIARAARAAVRHAAAQRTLGRALDLAALAAAVEDRAAGAYVDGRIAGLCHDGALELFRSAADGDALAVCEARLRRSA